MLIERADGGARIELRWKEPWYWLEGFFLLGYELSVCSTPPLKAFLV